MWKLSILLFAIHNYVITVTANNASLVANADITNTNNTTSSTENSLLPDLTNGSSTPVSTPNPSVEQPSFMSQLTNISMYTDLINSANSCVELAKKISSADKFSDLVDCLPGSFGIIKSELFTSETKDAEGRIYHVQDTVNKVLAQNPLFTKEDLVKFASSVAEKMIISMHAKTTGFLRRFGIFRYLFGYPDYYTLEDAIKYKENAILYSNVKESLIELFDEVGVIGAYRTCTLVSNRYHVADYLFTVMKEAYNVYNTCNRDIRSAIQDIASVEFRKRIGMSKKKSIQDINKEYIISEEESFVLVEEEDYAIPNSDVKIVEDASIKTPESEECLNIDFSVIEQDFEYSIISENLEYDETPEVAVEIIENCIRELNRRDIILNSDANNDSCIHEQDFGRSTNSKSLSDNKLSEEAAKIISERLRELGSDDFPLVPQGFISEVDQDDISSIPHGIFKEYYDNLDIDSVIFPSVPQSFTNERVAVEA